MNDIHSIFVGLLSDSSAEQLHHMGLAIKAEAVRRRALDGVLLTMRQAQEGIIHRSVTAEIFHEVVEATYKTYGVPKAELLGPKRARHISHPRQIAMASIRHRAEGAGVTVSYQMIADYFKREDHTTVIHAVQAVEARGDALL